MDANAEPGWRWAVEALGPALTSGAPNPEEFMPLVSASALLPLVSVSALTPLVSALALMPIVSASALMQLVSVESWEPVQKQDKDC